MARKAIMLHDNELTYSIASRCLLYQEKALSAKTVELSQYQLSFLFSCPHGSTGLGSIVTLYAAVAPNCNCVVTLTWQQDFWHATYSAEVNSSLVVTFSFNFMLLASALLAILCTHTPWMRSTSVPSCLMALVSSNVSDELTAARIVRNTRRFNRFFHPFCVST